MGGWGLAHKITIAIMGTKIGAGYSCFLYFFVFGIFCGKNFKIGIVFVIHGVMGFLAYGFKV